MIHGQFDSGARFGAGASVNIPVSMNLNISPVLCLSARIIVGKLSIVKSSNWCSFCRVVLIFCYMFYYSNI